MAVAATTVPNRKADFCGTHKLYLVRPDLGYYLESSDFTKGTDYKICDLHRDCSGGDHYLSYLHAPGIGADCSYFIIIYGDHFRRVKDLSTAADMTADTRLHEKCRGGDFYLGTSNYRAFKVSPSFIIIFPDKGIYRVVSDLGTAENAKEYKLHDTCKGGLYYWATKSIKRLRRSEVWYYIVKEEAGELRFHCTRDLKASGTTHVQMFHRSVMRFLMMARIESFEREPSLRSLPPANSVEYDTMLRTSADVITALAENHLCNALANQLKAEKIIGPAVYEQATTHAPQTTESMRVQHLMTALLSKVKEGPQHYYDFIKILRLDRIRPDAEAALKLLSISTDPQITEDPDSLENVIPGQRAEFVVKATGKNLTYTWHHQTDKGLPKEKREFDEKTHILHLNKVESSDEGYYICTISNPTGGSVETNPARLTTIPQITKEPNSLENTSLGKPAEFVVKAKGSHLTYTWHRQTTKELVPNEKRVSIGSTHILRISEVELSDDGYYICTICNTTDGSVETKPARLTTIPQITEEPDSLENVNPGKFAEFVVTATGKNLTYTWHRQTAKELIPNDKRVFVGDTQILHIDRVEPSDEGYYVCTISSPTGGTVETNPVRLTTIPQITEEPDSLENVAPGKPAEFAVKATGKNLTYTWHRQATEELLPNGKGVFVGNTQILHIDKVEPSDEGYYVCTISNTTGWTVETNPAQLRLTTVPQRTEEPDSPKNEETPPAQLQLTTIPQITEEPDSLENVETNPAQFQPTTIPQITEEPDSLENVAPGKPAEFVVKAIGKNLTYSWHRQATRELIPHDKRVSIGTTHTLRINKVESSDEGYYVCTISNPTGGSVETIPAQLTTIPQITEQPHSLENATPGKPVEFVVKAIGANLNYIWLWQTAKQFLPNNRRLYIGTTQILRINKVVSSDEGYYVCIICNSTGGTVETTPVQLTTIPQITEEPSSLENTTLGKPAVFVVKANGSHLTYSWYRQTAKQLSPNDKRVCVGNTQILRIDKVESSDEGYYICTVSNPTGGSVETRPAQLQLTTSTFLQITEEPHCLENATLGKPAQFVVKAKGSRLTYTWYRQATKELLPHGRRVSVGNTQILRIDKVKSSNEGYYVCTISNPTGGSVETNAVQLTTIPQITEEPDSLENAAPGKPAEFVVKAIGNNLTYTWHHQTSKQLLPREEGVLVGNTQILHIDKVESSMHEGYYICTISNPTGGSVETKPVQLTTIPQITEEPHSLENATLGKPAEFVVKANGSQLTYTWHHQATKELLPSDKRVSVGNTRILHIDKVESSDEGYYVCTISNPTGGSVETKPAQLQLTTSTLPQITEEPHSLENATPGKPAEFIVKANGSHLTYSWHRQATEELIPHDKRVSIGNTQILRIDKVESSDEGYYVCTISNPTGGRVETKPAQLQLTTTSNTTGGTVEINPVQLQLTTRTTICSKCNLPLIAVVLAIVSILIAGTAAGFGAYVWLQQQSDTCTAISFQEPEKPEAVSGRAGQVFPDFYCHHIESKEDLFEELKSIQDWFILCFQLGVGNEKLVGIKSIYRGDMAKKKCLDAFHELDGACWEKVVTVVSGYLFKDKRLAKEIADRHGIECSVD